MGKMALPNREAEDRWFAIDRQIRDSIWGGYDRNGDGVKETEAPLGQFGLTAADVQTANTTLIAISKITERQGRRVDAQTNGRERARLLPAPRLRGRARRRARLRQRGHVHEPDRQRR